MTVETAPIQEKSFEAQSDEELLGLIKKDEGTEELPSTEVPEAPLWSTKAEQSAVQPGVTNHVAVAPVVEAPQPVVAPEAAESVIKPIATGLTEEIPNVPVTTESTPIDSAFAQEKVEMVKANEEFEADVAETQQKFEEKIAPKPPVVSGIIEAPVAAVEIPAEPSEQEKVDKIEDPEERIEARKESIKEVLDKMREDLNEINESLDKKLMEAQSRFEDRIARADAQETEAKSEVQRAEAKRLEASTEKISAQNDLEKVQGEVSGKKADISAKLERLSTLEV